MTSIAINSKKDKNLIYYLSDFSPEHFEKNVPAHLQDNFAIDLFNLGRGNPENVDKLKVIIEDCAHPAVQAAYKDSHASLGRFLAACGVRSPLYVYTIDSDFYNKAKK